MRRLPRLSILLVLGLSHAIVSCKGEQVLDKRSGFSQKDFGELPLMPRGQVPANNPEFFPLMNESGRLKNARTKRPTVLAVGMNKGKDLECALPEHAKVYLVATIKSNMGASYAIAHVSQPCPSKEVTYKSASLAVAEVESESVSEIIEGYVAVDDVEAVGDEPTMTPTPSASATPDPTMVGCEEVKQVSQAKPDAACTPGKDINGSGMSVCGMPGSIFRQGGNGFDLNVTGKATKWRIKTTNESVSTNPNSKANTTVIPDKILAAADMKANGVNNFNVAFSNFIIPNDWTSARLNIKVEGLNDKDELIGKECQQVIQLASPIVLDFSGAEKLSLVSVVDSKINFDMNADGQMEKTGWILPTSGFLAMDNNKNGTIDDASELFGQHSFGKSFANGYLALSELDKKHKGFLDAKNKNFKKLLVWIDANSDGVSQKEELKTLAEMSITRIDTTHRSLAKNTKALFDNQILFESRFYGPKNCGSGGCKSYDVFFSTYSTVTATK